jgi:hypothetical protein
LKKEEQAALVFGATALVLTKLRKSKTEIPKQQRPVAPVSQADHVQGTFSVNSSGWDDNSSYSGGLFVGAASMGLAWYVWNKYRPKLRRFAAPPSA